MQAGLPTAFELEQNYPNPFNPLSTIRCSWPVAGKIRLEIFNVLGQRMALLEDGRKDAGYYRITWHPGVAASGVYFYRLQAGSFIKIRKMLLIRQADRQQQ